MAPVKKEAERIITSSSTSSATTKRVLRVKIWWSASDDDDDDTKRRRRHRPLAAADDDVGKLLRFSPQDCHDLETLKEQMATKLGLVTTKHAEDHGVVDLSEYDVCLGRQGTVQVQNVNEIDYGDELVLTKKKKKKKTGTAKVKLENQKDDKNIRGKEQEPASVSTEEKEEMDGSVEDVTDQIRQQQQEANRNPLVIDILESDTDDKDMSSEDEENDYSNDEKEYNDDDEDDAECSQVDNESSEDEDFVDKKPAARTVSRKRKATSASPRAIPDSRLEVLIDEKDVPTAPGRHNLPSTEATMQESSILAGSGDQAVKDRIIKLLNTGFHDKSNENEAQNAMKLAQRLMRKHNLSQALLLQERDAKQSQDDQNDQLLKGGLVEVNIVNRKTRNPAKFERWIDRLMEPVCENFAVDSYYTSHRWCCSVTFYGIYTNAQLAAYAFKIATERIAQMMAEFKPVMSPFGWTVSTKSARLSYALGIVKGISQAVDADMEREEKHRKIKLEKARLAASTGEAYEESEDEDDKECAGFAMAVDDSREDDASPSDPAEVDHVGSSLEPPLGNHSTSSGPDDTTSSAGFATSPPDASNKDGPAIGKNRLEGEKLDSRVREMEREEQAALVLVDRREKIAEEVLKKNNIKLSKATKQKPIQFDGASYRRGVEDSKEIDLNQRAIRAEIKVKKEMR
eukprot:scaffold6750_cov160-Amphora_coffeaeformis.AAC.8